MKKIMSIILSIIILIGLCVTGYAEDVTAPEMRMLTQDRYCQQYIYGEKITLTTQLINKSIFDDYEKIVVQLDFNNEVLLLNETLFGITINPYIYSKTETGCKVEVSGLDRMSNDVNAIFAFEVVGKGNPDVNVKAVKITADGKEEELVLAVDLPLNKVYEKEEIPEIITKLQPPVFGHNASFNSYGNLYVYSPQKVSEIRQMLSSSVEGCEIKYLPFGDTMREYVASGDIFALEFEGKLCDFVQLFVYGDATDDGKVTAADARLVLRHSAKLDDEGIYFSQYCDVNHDGELNAADARMILRVAAKIDYFRLKDITVWQNQTYQVGPIKSLSDAGYLWKCTVSDESAFEITEEIKPSVDNTGKPPEEIIVGASALQTFILKPLKQGEFEVHFELVQPWMNEPIKEFGFTVVVDGSLEQ